MTREPLPTLEEFRARYVPLDPVTAVASVAYWPVWLGWAVTCAVGVVVCWTLDRLR